MLWIALNVCRPLGIVQVHTNFKLLRWVTSKVKLVILHTKCSITQSDLVEKCRQIYHLPRRQCQEISVLINFVIARQFERFLSVRKWNFFVNFWCWKISPYRQTSVIYDQVFDQEEEKNALTMLISVTLGQKKVSEALISDLSNLILVAKYELNLGKWRSKDKRSLILLKSVVKLPFLSSKILL